MATTTRVHAFSSTKSDRSLGALLHLTTLTKYFIPFGNYIFPLIIWITKKQDSTFIDHHGRQSINFQISLFLYSIFLVLAGFTTLLILAVGKNSDLILTEDYFEYEVLSNLPFLLTLIAIGLLLLALVIIDLVCVITATIKAAEGKSYKFPLSIPFLPKVNTEQESKTDFRATQSNEDSE